MDVKQTPFSTKEEAKKRYVNTASKGSARYEKMHEDFAEMEKTGVQSPFADEMASFTERVKNDGKEELKMDRGGAKMRPTAPMAVTSGAMQKKESADDEELIFP